MTQAGRVDSVSVFPAPLHSRVRPAHRPILLPVRLSGVVDGAHSMKQHGLTTRKPT